MNLDQTDRVYILECVLDEFTTINPKSNFDEVQEAISNSIELLNRYFPFTSDSTSDIIQCHVRTAILHSNLYGMGVETIYNTAEIVRFRIESALSVLVDE